MDCDEVGWIPEKMLLKYLTEQIFRSIGHEIRFGHFQTVYPVENQNTPWCKNGVNMWIKHSISGSTDWVLVRLK